MTRFVRKDLDTMLPGLKLFNAEKYWECHEELEGYWMDLRGEPIRNIYWAIIQVATSLFHVRNTNIAGAQGMLAKALDKLQRVEKDQLESEFLNRSLAWDSFKRKARAVPKNSDLTDFDELLQFKFPID